jgi:hypothetical protein
VDAPAHSPAPLEADRQGTEPAPPRHRRRASALRKPVLVAHQVFEPVRPAPLPSAASSPSLDIRNSVALREALKELDDTLLAVGRGQEAFRTLDQLLSSLRIPGIAAPRLK